MGMLRWEREELERLTRDRERIARGATDARAAEMKADFERQIAADYSFDQSAIWTQAVERTNEVVKEGQRQIAQECMRLGIPPEFAPSINFAWYGRNENRTASRRAELRKVAYTRIDAMAKDAKTKISLSAAEVRVRLLEGSLQSDEAKQFIQTIPTPEALMQPLVLKEIEKEVSRSRYGLLE